MKPCVQMSSVLRTSEWKWRRSSVAGERSEDSIAAGRWDEWVSWWRNLSCWIWSAGWRMTSAATTQWRSEQIEEIEDACQA